MRGISISSHFYYVLNSKSTTMTKSLILALLFHSVLLNSNAKSTDLKLELVQVIFRHGDRYPSKSELALVGEDDYSDFFENFNEISQLQKVGKQREYYFGWMLRKRYDEFLGDFKYKEVYARSTDVDRTKMSLQLALAGLYPPTPNNSWNDKLQWSPIPTFYEKREFDWLDIPYDGPCLKNGKLIEKAMKSPDIVKRMEKHQELIDKLEDEIAVNNMTPSDGFSLYTYLTSIMSMDLPLPFWSTPEDFEELREIADIYQDVIVHTEEIRRITVGPTIEEILKNIDNNEKDGRKIYLYAAHDTNVSPFVRTHNFTGIPIYPDFGSAVLIEKLRSKANKIYIRFYYWTGTTGKMVPVKLENCEDNCLISKYRAAVSSLIPSEEEKACFSPKIVCDKKSPLYKRIIKYIKKFL